MSEHDRKRAFVIAAASIAAFVALLSLLNRPEPEPLVPERPVTERRTPGAAPAEGAQPARTPESKEPPVETTATTPGSESSPVGTTATAPGSDSPVETTTDSGEADPASVADVPAGQEREVPVAATLPSPAPPAVRAVAERFARAYLVYELGLSAPAARAVVVATTAGRLKRQLIEQPPRAPLGVKLRRGRLVGIERVTAAEGRYDVTYSVRRGKDTTLHLVEVSRRGDRWTVTGIQG